ncbi:Iron-regulated protein A [Vibrio stylophorae]|uniref:Iron-regulated protein A n=1 Tax=Vibrio stylophorae TaxID=659351 RepID=A0ABM8ZX50_9VIBR|nr:imelysin family protein [Vibrio stylophorae]CAH0535226.1 Iron-regulated protein A [Vibrio stylophorae]
MKRLLITALTALTMTGCAQHSTSSQFTNQQKSAMVNHVVDDIIVANYQFMDDQLLALLADVQALAKDRSPANLKAAQQSWRKARIGFEIAEAHLFGPVVSLGIDPALDSWPLDTEQLQLTINIANQLKNSAQLDQFSASLNDDVVGFHSVEYLLFGENNNQRAKNISDQQAHYLVLLVQRMVNTSAELQNSWQQSFEQGLAYRQQMTQYQAGLYANEDAVIEELVNGMITIVDEVGTAKLIDPLGDSIATAVPSAVESPYSWGSTQDFFYNIVGVKQVWLGENLLLEKNTQGNGLYHYIASKDQALADQVSKEIDEAINAIVAISYSQYLSGSGAIHRANGDTKQLALLIEQDDIEFAFKSQILTNSGRKKIRAAEAKLDALSQTLTEQVLPLLQ